VSNAQLDTRAQLDEVLGQLAREAAPDRRRDLELELREVRFRTARQLLEQPMSPSTGHTPRSGSPLWDDPIPRAPFAELRAADLASGLASHGCVQVTRLLEADVVGELVASIDQVFVSYDDVMSVGDFSRGDEWCQLFMPDDSLVHVVRPWMRGVGGVFTADSPRVSARWFGLLRDVGVLDVVGEFFGEPPITSLDKCTLRRVRGGSGSDWHQDGAFLGVDSGALNLWVSLSDTATAPGLDVIARRFDDVVETGTGSADYSWSIGPELVDSLVSEAPIVQPHFAAGDALFFDSCVMHRTQQHPVDLPETRYAIETWFFPPSRFPRQQEVPLAL
jgi:hypothetical protein